MVKKIELYDKNIKFSCEFYVDDILKSITKTNNRHIFFLDNTPAHIKIKIDPHKLQPLVRFDDVLVNYGLAKITPWDHMLEFTISDNFLEDYFKEIVKSKQEYLKTSQEEIKKIMGLNSEKQLVDKILNNLK